MTIIKQNVDKNKTGKKDQKPSMSWRGTGQEWITLGLMAYTLGVAVYSIEHSKWINPQPPLMLIFGAAIIIGLITAKSRLPAAALVAIGLIAGCAITLWQVLNLFAGFSMTAPAQWGIHFNYLLWVATSGQSSFSVAPFVIFLTFSTWLMAYFSTWFLIRRHNAWLGVILGTIAVLVNLSNISGRHYIYFLLFFPAAGLLIGQMNLTKHYRSAGGQIKKLAVRSTAIFTASALVLSVVAVSIAWSVPTERANYLQTVIVTKMPWQNILDNMRVNIFASVPSKWRILASEDQQALTFGEPHLGPDVLFNISAPKAPAYLRTWSYDVYHSWGWTSSATGDTLLPRNTPPKTELSKQRVETTYKVINKSRTDIILAEGEFLSTDIPVTMHSLTENKDVLTISSLYKMKPDDVYTIKSGLSGATPEELAQAGQNYPDYISDYYFQLPTGASRRITSLTQMVTRNTDTPYDKAVAIIQYLSRFDYLPQGSSPPAGTDGVQHFLLTTQTGNCTNFASAMAVMLRSAGVPARLSSGYLVRETDAKTGAGIIRADDYHARPEVYFPGYGWVEFEATPIPDNAAGINMGLATVPTDAQTPDAQLPDPAIPAVDTSAAAADAQTSGFGLFIDWIDAGPGATPLERTINTLLTVFIAALVMMLIAFGVFYTWVRRMKKARTPSEVFAKMCSLGSLLKLHPEPYSTPLEYRAALVAAFPAQAEAIDDLTWAYLRNVYGTVKEIGEAEKRNLRRSWNTVRPVFIKRLINNRFRFFRKS